ncbi:MAG: SDR family NAD(P)-dependent oxidoreductase [Thermodesulfobacteriota bacterium]
MKIDLTGKAALVTGAARGIGRAVALALARAGADVALTDVRDDIAASEIGQAGARVLARKMDVTRFDEVLKVVKEVRASWGGLDILVNNAAVLDNFALIDRQDPERFERDLRINLTGAFHCAKAVWPGMVEKGWGRIVNVSSITALGGAFAHPSYGASKAGLLGLTTSLALEGARLGITVNAVMPGLIDTEAVRSHGPEVINKAKKRIPLERLGAPEEVASTIVFLASEAAGYITGAAVPVTGGLELFKI